MTDPDFRFEAILDGQVFEVGEIKFLNRVSYPYMVFDTHGQAIGDEYQLPTLRQVSPDINALFDALTDDKRMDVFSDYCCSCGSKNPSCQCWNDE